MKALIKILSNESNRHLHPILYFQSPLPGGNDTDVVRWKSKGHHTDGFDTMDDALKYVDQLEAGLISKGIEVTKRVEDVLLWNGIELPLDVTLEKVC